MNTSYIFVILGILLIILTVVNSYYEYEAIKKFYPNLTYCDYLRVQDKIRITPNGDK